MRIVCPECDRDIPASDVSIATGVAKCTGCDAVFGFLDQVSGSTGSAAPRKARDVAPQPKSFEVVETGGELGIRFHWRNPYVYPLIAFCLFWDGFLVVWYVIAFATNGPWIMKVFPILHVAVGASLTYFVVASLINRTTLLFGLGQFQVKHGPLPWPGNRIGSADEIDQLYVTTYTQGRNRSSQFVYAVMVRMKDGEKFKLVSGFDDLDKAIYLEQTIEEFLGIIDRRMPEEVENV